MPATYASDTTDEYGDLIGEDGETLHQYDAQANTNALLDAAGDVQARYKYTAFGEVSAVSVDGSAWTTEDWESLPLDLTSHMLAGGKKHYYLDMETRLYLLGAGNPDKGGRYYDAVTGRFLSEDPDRQAGSGANLFAYGDNDPVNNLDPSGHDARADAAAAKRKQEERLRREEEARRQAAAEADRVNNIVYNQGGSRSAGTPMRAETRKLTFGEAFGRAWQQEQKKLEKDLVFRAAKGLYRTVDEAVTGVPRGIAAAEDMRDARQRAIDATQDPKGDRLNQRMDKARGGLEKAIGEGAQALAGQRLTGQMILEVPVQNKPIPQPVFDAAKKAQVIIRDVNGKVY